MDICCVCLQCVEIEVQPECCRQKFCFMCLKGAVLRTKKCPLCRREIVNGNKFHHRKIHVPCNGWHWFYEDTDTSSLNSWWMYDFRTNEILEEAFKHSEDIFDVLICGTIYTIDFEHKVQYQKENIRKKRQIKRGLASSEKKGVAGISFDNNLVY